jgi:ring-1,2-phenylacetyl-CoA epoxidase subunit PaaE
MAQAPKRRKRGWMNMRVAKIKDETWDTKTFYFIDDDDNNVPFDYIAGQYLTFRYDGLQDKPLARSYTMSSSPSQTDYIAVTVKRVEDGIVSNWMCDQLKEGDILKARGPIGRFCYHPDQSHPHLIMVGAGSGVTPFLSIIREYAPKLGSEGAPAKVSLLVAYRSKQDLIAWDDLQELAKVPGVAIQTTLTREDATAEGFLHGRPDVKMLEAFIGGEYARSTFMTCGPEAMMNMTVEHLKAMGVQDDHIQLEAFY